MRARATTSRPRWQGRLLLAPGVALYLGPGSAADTHAHNAVQFVWSAQSEVSLCLDDRTVRARAFLVPAGIAHGFDASAQSIALLLVERHGARGASLDRRARALLGLDLASALAGLRFPTVDFAPDGALAWCDAVLGALGAGVAQAPPLSRASRRAIDHVERHLDGTPRLSDAARSSGVSATRLTHVFSREVGVPFRRYVLWARLRRAVEATRRGASTTTAAVAAGFSDGAHLSRTFRATFGLPPSQVLPFVEIVGGAWDDRNLQARSAERR